MTRRQAAAADRRMSGRHGPWHCPDGTARSFLRHPRHPMSLGGFFLYSPLIALALEDILHRQSRSWRGVSLGLKTDCSGSFILMVGDGHHFHVHRRKIGTLGEVGHDTLFHGVVILYVAFASAEHGDGQPKRGTEKGKAFHTPIIDCFHFCINSKSFSTVRQFRAVLMVASLESK